MKVSDETFIETNYTTKINFSNQRTSSGFFPLLKFNENLYNSCQSKFSKYIENKRNDIKLIVNNKINQHISISDYMAQNDISSDKLALTPIPFVSKRRIKNNLEKKDLNNFQRNVVLMRRLEYQSKMREKKMKQKYKNQIPKIVHLQKIIRGYLVRKVIHQVNIIKETLTNFFYSINFCIRKKYFHILKRKINKMKEKDINDDDFEDNNKENTIVNHNNNFGFENDNNETNEEVVIKQFNEFHSNNLITNENIEDKIIKGLKAKSNNEEFIGNSGNKKGDNIEKIKINHNTKYNQSPFINKEKEKDKLDSIIENDDYIDFSNKNSKKNKKIYKIIKGINEMNESNINNKDNNKDKDNSKDKKECKNKNPKNNKTNLILSNISSFKEIEKANSEIIQRQFRKHLSKKGYYGKFDIRKIAIVYLMKNMIFFNVRPYVFTILKLNNKKIKNTITTQEENFFSITTERIIKASHRIGHARVEALTSNSAKSRSLLLKWRMDMLLCHALIGTTGLDLFLRRRMWCSIRTEPLL